MTDYQKDPEGALEGVIFEPDLSALWDISDVLDRSSKRKGILTQNLKFTSIRGRVHDLSVDMAMHDFPVAVERLTKVQRLEVKNFSTSRFPQALMHLFALTSLVLKGFVSHPVVPPWLLAMPHLQALTLQIGLNSFLEVPWIRGPLTMLDLSHNSIDRLPESIERFRELEVMNVAANNLHQLPKSVGEMSRLRILDASENRIISFPKELRRLYRLERLMLDGNPLQDPFTQLVSIFPTITKDIAGKHGLEIQARSTVFIVPRALVTRTAEPPERKSEPMIQSGITLTIPNVNQAPLRPALPSTMHLEPELAVPAPRETGSWEEAREQAWVNTKLARCPKCSYGCQPGWTECPICGTLLTP